MTKKNIKINISEELKRAKESFNAAAVLFDNKLLNDAISRLYYFIFYNVRALLLTKGFEPKSHEGALRLLGLHFIKTGLFKPKLSHIFSKLMKYREEADYNPSYIFTIEDFIELRDEVSEQTELIREYLKERGYSG